MKLEEFQEVLRSVVGPDVEDTWVERFFSEVRRYKEMSYTDKKKEKHIHTQHIPSAFTHCGIKHVLG